MLLENQQLFGSGLLLTVMDDLKLNGDMTMTELIERLCKKYNIENARERSRLYDRCLRIAHTLESMKKVTIVQLNTGAGNKKIKICLAST